MWEKISQSEFIEAVDSKVVVARGPMLSGGEYEEYSDHPMQPELSTHRKQTIDGFECYFKFRPSA